MKKKLIEMVCTGNNGRSPVAELLARNYIEQIGADNEYGVISSGTAVSLIGTDKLPVDVMKPVISVGLSRGVYENEQVKDVEEALRGLDVDAVRKYFRVVENQFFSEEREHRMKILPELGIKGMPKETKDQTVVRRDVAYIFPVDNKNKDRVLAIYSGSNPKPSINVLSAFATRNPDAEINNTFGKGEEVYRQSVERMMTEVPLAINRILEESA